MEFLCYIYPLTGRWLYAIMDNLASFVDDGIYPWVSDSPLWWYNSVPESESSFGMLLMFWIVICSSTPKVCCHIWIATFFFELVSLDLFCVVLKTGPASELVRWLVYWSIFWLNQPIGLVFKTMLFWDIQCLTACACGTSCALITCYPMIGLFASETAIVLRS
jgi:hypothetical protein